PTIFMENRLEAADTIRDQGTIFAPAGQARIGFVAVSDVAKAAARVLTSDGHEDMIYVLSGPESLSYADVAARVSAGFARQVGCEGLPARIARERMPAGGLSPGQPEPTIELYDWIRPGEAATVTSSVRDLTGQEAPPAAAWLTEMRAASPAPRADPPPK